MPSQSLSPPRSISNLTSNVHTETITIVGLTASVAAAGSSIPDHAPCITTHILPTATIYSCNGRNGAAGSDINNSNGGNSNDHGNNNKNGGVGSSSTVVITSGGGGGGGTTTSPSSTDVMPASGGSNLMHDLAALGLAGLAAVVVRW